MKFNYLHFWQDMLYVQLQKQHVYVWGIGHWFISVFMSLWIMHFCVFHPSPSQSTTNMPVTTSIKSYLTGRVPKQGIPMIQVFVHKTIGDKKYLVSDSTGTAILVAEKENHVQVIKAKVV